MPARSNLARLHAVPLNPDTAVAAEPLLESYRRYLQFQRKRPDSIRVYIKAPEMFIAFCRDEGLPTEPSRARREYIERWMLDVQREHSAHTQRSYFVWLRLWFRWLAEEGEIAKDPTERMKLPRLDEPEKDVLDPEEVRTVLNRLEKAKRWRDLAIIAVLYDTGCRATELCLARRDALLWEPGVLRLQGETTKNHDGRVLSLSPTALRHIDRYLRHRTDTLPWLFVGRSGPMNRSSLYKMVAREFVATGKKIGPHDLRHTSASHIAGEISETALMDLYGWRSSDMPRHYTRSVRQELALEAHRRASPLEKLR